MFLEMVAVAHFIIEHPLTLAPGHVRLSEVADACLLLGTDKVLMVALLVLGFELSTELRSRGQKAHAACSLQIRPISGPL